MKLKLDENLGTRAAALARQAGHDVATVHEEGLCATPDTALIEVCRAEGCCLVTLDLDFSNPLVFDPARYAGIAILRLPPEAGIDEILDALRTLLNGLEQREVGGRLWIVQRGRIREYEPAS